MSYIGVERSQTDSLINWSEVGSKITTALNTEADRRTTEKKKIDDESNAIVEFAKTKAPVGNADEINKIAINLSEQVQARQLQANRMLKNGVLSQRDYALLTNNVKSNVSVMFDLGKDYQTEYDDKMKRAQDGTGSRQEVDMMAWIEGFGNLKDLLPVIGKDGTMYLAKRGPDGKPLTGADNVMTPMQARARIKEKIDKFKLDENVSESAKSLGKTVTESIGDKGDAERLGFIRKLNDPTQMKDLSYVEGNRSAENLYLKAEKALIAKDLSSPFAIASTLTDFLNVNPSTGNPFKVTTDRKLAESDSDYILWSEKNGIFSPDFESTGNNGKYQKLKAEEYYRTRLRASLNSEEDISTIQQPTPPRPEPKQPVSEWMVNRGDSQRDFKLKGNMIAHLFSGDPAQVQAATSHFGGDPRFISVRRTADGIIVTDNKNITKTIPFKNPNGTVMTQDDFIRSATPLLLGANADINAVVQGARSTGRSNLNATAKAEAIATSPVQESGDIRSTIITKIGSDVEALGLKDANGKFLKDKQILSVVQPLLTTLGIKARTYNWDEGIIITKRDGKTVEIPIDENFKRTLVSALNDAVPPDTGDAVVGSIFEKMAGGLGITGAAAKWNKKKTD